MTIGMLSVATIVLSSAVAAMCVVDLFQYRKLRAEYVGAGILQGGK